MISSYHGSTCRYWRVPLLNCRSFDMPDIVVVFVWVVLDFVSHGLTADSMGVACFCVVACWFLACGMIFIGWWRGAWYIDECLLLMWLLCPALDLYVISEIVHLFRFVKGQHPRCFWVMCVQAFPLSKRYIGGTAIHICPLLRDVFSCHLFS